MPPQCDPKRLSDFLCCFANPSASSLVAKKYRSRLPEEEIVRGKSIFHVLDEARLLVLMGF